MFLKKLSMILSIALLILISIDDYLKPNDSYNFTNAITYFNRLLFFN
ncbi:hypothetical protein [Paraclostridium bifermentans]|nr:hypothetical protein [Paraclostridium bifermentans]